MLKFLFMLLCPGFLGALTLGNVASGVGIASGLNSLFGGGSQGSQPNPYTPQSLNTANQGWVNAYGQLENNAQNVQNTAMPAYQQSLNAANAINYSPYQQAAQQAGQQYGNLAGMAQGQMPMYGQQAQQGMQQQGNLYGGANQVMQTAFDPQNALYNQTQNQLAGQVNAGQAARGLGNSPVGGQEFNNAMQNFDIGWQNEQLARQAQGLQAAGGATNAGTAAGQFAGTSMQNQLGAGAAGAGYMQQAGQIPIQAQQYVAGQPAANANVYGQNVGNLNSLYQNVANTGNAYMAPGAQNVNAANTFNAGQSAAGMQSLLTGLNDFSPYTDTGAQGQATGNNLYSNYVNPYVSQPQQQSTDLTSQWTG